MSNNLSDFYQNKDVCIYSENIPVINLQQEASSSISLKRINETAPVPVPLSDPVFSCQRLGKNKKMRDFLEKINQNNSNKSFISLQENRELFSRRNSSLHDLCVSRSITPMGSAKLGGQVKLRLVKKNKEVPRSFKFADVLEDKMTYDVAILEYPEHSVNRLNSFQTADSCSRVRHQEKLLNTKKNSLMAVQQVDISLDKVVSNHLDPHNLFAKSNTLMPYSSGIALSNKPNVTSANQVITGSDVVENEMNEITDVKIIKDVNIVDEITDVKDVINVQENINSTDKSHENYPSFSSICPNNKIKGEVNRFDTVCEQLISGIIENVVTIFNQKQEKQNHEVKNDKKIIQRTQKDWVGKTKIFEDRIKQFLNQKQSVNWIAPEEVGIFLDRFAEFLSDRKLNQIVKNINQGE